MPPLQTGLSAITSLFIGSYADKFGMRATVNLAWVGECQPKEKSIFATFRTCLKEHGRSTVLDRFWALGVSGLILADLVDYFNYAYFDILPLQFLWTEQVVQSLAVGMTVGIYGLAANHSGEEGRATLLYPLLMFFHTLYPEIPP